MIAQIVEERFNKAIRNTTERQELTERVTEIFDTTQPADNLTGTPPLKSRTSERRDSRTKSENRTQTEATATEQTEIDSGSIAILTAESTTAENSDQQSESEATHTQERKSGGTLAIVQISAGIIIGLFLLWLLITVLRAIKSFINIH